MYQLFRKYCVKSFAFIILLRYTHTHKTKNTNNFHHHRLKKPSHQAPTPHHHHNAHHHVPFFEKRNFHNELAIYIRACAEILRPIGLGLSYVSAMKETMDIEFQDKRIRVVQREAEGEENIGLVVWDATMLFGLT